MSSNKNNSTTMIAVGVAIVAVSGAAYYFMRARFIKDVNMIVNPLDDTKKRPQPQTKVALQTMIKKYCEGKKFYGKPNTWDVTLVTDMSCLFEDMEKFNAPIDQWNTSQVINMGSMFSGASSFNQPITMDTSKVTGMSSMFEGASSFNSPITMNTSKVTNMMGMFKDASSFNSPITMDTSKVTNMERMFEGADAMTHPHPIRLNVRHFFFWWYSFYECRGTIFFNFFIFCFIFCFIFYN